MCSPAESVLTFNLCESQEVKEQSVKLEMVKRERNHSAGGGGSHHTSTDSLMTLSPSTSVHRLSGTANLCCLCGVHVSGLYHIHVTKNFCGSKFLQFCKNHYPLSQECI